MRVDREFFIPVEMYRKNVEMSLSDGENAELALGGKPISFFVSKSWFPFVVIGSDAWKEVGYQAIVFIAAITGISPDLYEASALDGAGKLKQIIHITIPGIMPTIILMFILQLGSILNANTEQILLMYNPTVYETGDVLGTSVYRNGVAAMKYCTTPRRKRSGFWPAGNSECCVPFERCPHLAFSLSFCYNCPV